METKACSFIICGEELELESVRDAIYNQVKVTLPDARLTLYVLIFIAMVPALPPSRARVMFVFSPSLNKQKKTFTYIP